MSSSGPERPGAGALLAAAAGFALAAWLALPQYDPRPGRPLRVVVFDRSASVARTRPSLAAWIRTRAAEEAAAAERDGSDFAALVFAGDCAWWTPPGPPRRAPGALPPGGNELESDLTSALELARQGALAAGSAGGSVHLCTDGRATSGSVAAPLAALAAAGFAVERLELPAPELDDLALETLRAPQRVERGAPLACEVRVRLAAAPVLGAAPRRVKLLVAVSGAGSTSTFEFERTLAADGRAAAWRLDLGPAPAGGARLEARAELAGDPTPENDRASAWVETGGALEIAVVAGEPGLAEAFAADAERWPGLALLPGSAAELPDLIARVRALVTLDVDEALLPAELLRQFLAAGGGWLDCSGNAALASPPAAGRAAGARALLPLAPRAPERPARDVVLLVDSSGSMAGEAIAGVRAAAAPLAEVVPASDRVLLQFFARELEPPVVLREAGAVRAPAGELATALRARPPAGGTDIVGALEALAARAGAAQRDTFALLLSDGRDPSAPGRPDLSALRGQLARARIELAVIAFGPDADVEFLGRLLPDGRAPLAAADAAELAGLLARAAVSERVRDSTAAVASAPESLPAESLARELARSLAPPPSPLRAWIARAAPDAGVLWRTAQGDPLLALWPRGLGSAAAFASTPAREWAPAAATPAALGPLVRALARGGQLPALPRAGLAGPELTVRGLPPNAPALVTAVLPGGAELALTPPAQGGDPPRTTRRARLPRELALELARRGGAPVLLLRGPEGQALGAVAVLAPSAPEFRAEPAALPEAAAAGAGSGATRDRLPHAGAAWVLAGALALLAGSLLRGFQPRGRP